MVKKATKKPVNHKSVTYFPTHKSAVDYAEKHGLTTKRIIEYVRGFAIQKDVSGKYYNILKRRWE